MDLNGLKHHLEALSLEEKIKICEHLSEEIKKESGISYGMGFVSNWEDVDIEVMVNCLSANDLAAIFSALAQKTRREKPFSE
ncbi:MAG: hypothetical protein J7647_01335 [Cyanobacteria bacterium SBLK]|nr:hypothetical protein [Cyanobacteria bacterium SBLK]